MPSRVRAPSSLRRRTPRRRPGTGISAGSSAPSADACRPCRPRPSRSSCGAPVAVRVAARASGRSPGAWGRHCRGSDGWSQGRPQALRLASAEGRCGQSPVSVSVSSALLSAVPPEVLGDLAGGSDARPARQSETSSPAAGRLSQAAGARSSKSGTRPTTTIQSALSSLPSLPSSGSAFPWLWILLVALAAGALAVIVSRRTLTLTYLRARPRARDAGWMQGGRGDGRRR